MERAVEIFAAICFFVVGVSHIAQPMGWVEFFIWLREKGRAGIFVVGFMSLNFGAIIVGFHNVWSGPPMVLTIVGWSQVIKGLLYLSIPQVGMKSLNRITAERTWWFQVGGIISLALSGLIGYKWAS